MTDPATGALVGQLQRDLDWLHRMPYQADHVTAVEVLEVIRFARSYGVDWTRGLEPTGAKGEAVRSFRVRVLEGMRESWRDRVVRVQCVALPGHPDGVALPDGDVVWFHEILGQLVATILTQLQAVEARLA